MSVFEHADAHRCVDALLHQGQRFDGTWSRSHGNEHWAFDEHGLMRRRDASIDDVTIASSERRFLWPLGPRPEDHPGLTELGL